MIDRLQLRNFTCFVDNQFEFVKGINVFIGENGTGKTHLLKVLAGAMLGAMHIQDESPANIYLGRNNQMLTNYAPLYYLFSVRHIIPYPLPHKNKTQDPYLICLFVNKEPFIFLETITNKGNSSSARSINEFNFPVKVLFVPTREVLTNFKGFAALYERREIRFEYTEYLLCKALEVPLLRKESNLEVYEFVKELEAVLQAKIIQQNGEFYFHFNGDKEPTPANLVAEGWRKIATYIYLILNGELELNDRMVLLIDEPEANLNPALIETMALFLNKLAAKGVQIFLSTHNQLLPNYLSWNTDFKTENSPATRFFGLSRLPDNAGIAVETADSIDGLPNNPMLDASLRFYKSEEQKYSGE